MNNKPAQETSAIALRTPARQPWDWATHFQLDVYTRPDRESAEIRAAHIAAIVRMTPVMMVVNLLNVALVLWTFAPAPPRALWAWAAVLSTLAALALHGAWRSRNDMRLTASPRAVRRAALHAGLLGLVWGILPVMLFPTAAAQQQMLLACLICGMLGAGAFALATVPHASVAYAITMASGAVAALALSELQLRVEILSLLFLYTVAVIVGALQWARKSTALLRSERQSARQQHVVSLLLHDFESHAAEALWEIGADGHLAHASPRLAELLGAEPAALQGAPLLSLLRERDTAAATALAAAFDRGQPFQDLRLAVPQGDAWRWWAVRGKPMRDDEGAGGGWRGVVADITTEVQAQRRLHALAHSDSLTGLANRLSLHEALADALRRECVGALLSLDLDHFKAINDSFGHSTGDQVLAAVAQRLRQCVRPGDLVARLGGDEFAVLAYSAGTPQDAQALAARLVQQMALPVDVSGRALRVGASVGVTTWSEGGCNADEVMVRADLALYEAKDGGRARHVLYEAGIGERNKRRAGIENDLRAALDNGQFEVHFQPKADLAQWRIVGVEALLRWTHPVLGPISPGEFVPIAEQCGLIDTLGSWVLDQACQAAAGALPGLDVAVNVSPAQLRDGAFARQVSDALIKSGLEPFRLELEITESVFLEDIDSALSQLAALRALGVRIALDDFGTGYSSLAYLRRFPFDTLKIDRAFVNELILRDDARAIVRMMTQRAATMGMRTVAEGVETPAQLDEVRRAGCDAVQGYHIARPLPLAQMAALLRDWRPATPTLAA